MMQPRAGFSIVEVVVAIVLMAVILTGLAGLTYTTARQAVYTSDATTQQAYALETVNRYSSLPFDSLAASVRRDTAGTANNRYERRVTITGTGNARSIVVLVTPLQRRAPATSTTFTRVAPPPPSNPLCIGC